MWKILHIASFSKYDGIADNILHFKHTLSYDRQHPAMLCCHGNIWSQTSVHGSSASPYNNLSKPQSSPQQCSNALELERIHRWLCAGRLTVNPLQMCISFDHWLWPSNNQDCCIVWRWWLTETNYYFHSNNSNFQLGSPSRKSWFLHLIYPKWHEMCEMFLCACILHCCWERHYSGWWIVFASVTGFYSVLITWSIRTDHWACTLIMTSTSQQPLLIVN